MGMVGFRCSARNAGLAAGLGAVFAMLTLVPAFAGGGTTPKPADLTGMIDQGIEAGWKERSVTPARASDDATFVRRVYLDLAGRIPTVAEADGFVAEKQTGKRAALVDRLLQSPEYAAHLRDVFDVVFNGRGPAERPRMRRRGGTGDLTQYREQWLGYLQGAFAENRAWDRILRDLLVARPEREVDRGAVWFLYSRQGQFQQIAETIGPSAFGVQIACAQCHDHPQAKEIKQAHYWGLVAFYNRGQNLNTEAGPRVGETATGGFNKFSNLSGESYPALLSFLGAPTVDEMRPPDGKDVPDAPELYHPVPDGAGPDYPKVPRFSRREQFVDKVVTGNPLVARAAVNRFWALLMGRGFVHPVDKMDSVHPPSHPALLQRLADEFARSRFDVKHLIRGIVLSRAYQLDSRHAGTAQPDSFSYALDKPLSAEALYRSLLVAATGKAEGEDTELREAVVKVFPDLFPEEINSTLRQTMFMSNSAVIRKAAAGGTLSRLAAIAEPEARAREAFRVAYGRAPDREELRESAAYLKARADRPAQATEQLWWALLAGAEFRFNH
jgi:hypothetical protein